MRGAWGKAATFLAFLRRQRRNAARIRSELSPLDGDAVRLTGAETDWTPTGFVAAAGRPFRATVSGHVWLSKPLALAFDAPEAVWLRIGAAPPRKVVAADAVYEAWADGPVEALLKGLSNFEEEGGPLAPGPRKALPGGVGVKIDAVDAPADLSQTPEGWRPHWQIGEGRVFRPFAETPGGVEVDTHGDVGIIRRPVETAFKPGARLDWAWRIDELPSTLAEDLAFTHDYLSIAVEFENGLDLTYMWSAELPEEHVFQCPLDWWCDRETHWVVRSGREGLGLWREESRDLWNDYPKAIKGPRPERIVGVWLIANSIFQRGRGRAAFRDIAVAAPGA